MSSNVSFKAQPPRVRFAPSPTGFMHLGNIRAALLNYIFAKQKNGTLIIRVEDTDVERNIDEAGLKILKDLEWLSIRHDEGPYFQSDRKNIYQELLDDLIENRSVYRCFCSPEELEKKRREQVSQGAPPRYDRTCLHLSDDHIKQKIAAGKSFVWRFKLNQDQTISVKSMSRGEISFDMKHFSDFVLSRSDGSFMFLFTNFVDDWTMKITHIIRGEDHLSNTAMQAALYNAFAVEMPVVWHLPILCNREGKKLSKRDFGFKLDDLKKEGFLPEAICNYLAIIGASFKNEIQSIDELIHNFDFENLNTTGQIGYDVEKLKWVNHKWIGRLESKAILPYLVPLLNEEVHASKSVDENRLIFLVDKVKNDCKTLVEIVNELRFCFEDPVCDIEEIDRLIGKEKTNLIATLLDKIAGEMAQKEQFLSSLKREGKESGLKPKELFSAIRYLLTGKFQGVGIGDLLEMLDDDQIKRRFKKF